MLNTRQEGTQMNHGYHGFVWVLFDHISPRVVKYRRKIVSPGEILADSWVVRRVKIHKNYEAYN